MYRLYRKTRNSPNGYVATAGGVQEMEVNTQTKYDKYVKVSNGQVHHIRCVYEVSLA